MEYIEHGDLGTYIKTAPLKAEALEITKQILEGLKVLHSKEIYHRDLKPEVSLSLSKKFKFLNGLSVPPPASTSHKVRHGRHGTMLNEAQSGKRQRATARPQRLEGKLDRLLM